MDTQQREPLYLDRESLERLGGTVGILLPGRQVVLTGTAVHREPEALRGHPALEPFLREDFHFIFEGDTVRPEFYTVPAVVLLGHDSAGGWFASAGEENPFQDNAPLLYLSAERRAYAVTGESRQFLTGNFRWREALEPTDAVRVYGSRQEAEQEYRIHDAVRSDPDGGVLFCP